MDDRAQKIIQLKAELFDLQIELAKIQTAFKNKLDQLNQELKKTN